MDVPLEVCEARDPKGLYARAKAGGLSHAIGVGGDYEAPERPEVHVATDAADVEVLVTRVMAAL